MPNFDKNSVEWALEHLFRHNDTDIFPKIFEYEAMHFCKDEVIRMMTIKDMNQWVTRPLRKCLTPKNYYGYRIATQLDPLDTLAYVSLIYRIGEELEKSRVKPENEIAFSSRFGPDSDYYMFNRNIGFNEFQNRSRELSKTNSFVVLTDISDFYNRLYLHRIENALRSTAKSHPNEASTTIALIKSWNQKVSYSIPVGNNPSRLIAEIVIDDVDRALLAEGINHIRYVDDYRIFSKSPEDARKALIILANLLYDMHGLTLQTQKTKILESSVFVKEYLDNNSILELNALNENFSTLLRRIGVDDPYQIIELDDLPDGLLSQINELNLTGLLSDELSKNEPELQKVKFLLSRLSWIKNIDIVDLLLFNLDKIHPLLDMITKYLATVGDLLDEKKRHEIGSKLLGKIDYSVLCQLEYHKMLLLSLFAGSKLWGNEEKLQKYYTSATSDLTRRTLLLALGKSHQDFAFRSKKSQIDQMSSWEKRALIYGASCLPGDERDTWYKAINPKIDELDRFIVKWAQSNPI